ncbi:hypothetical protein KUCAC02_014749, partial [Chaenocephalus aceratus]
MDMLEQSLDSASQEKQEEEVVQTSEDGTGEEHTAVTIASVQQAAAFGDHNIQYQFRTEGGQVTYRVVQVTDQHLDGRDDGGGAVSVVSTAAFAGSPQAVAQAVIQNPFSNGGSPAGETVGGETRFAYFPATAVSDGTVSVQAAADPTLTQAGARGITYCRVKVESGFQASISYELMAHEALETGTQRIIAPRTQSYPADENELLQQEGLNWKMDGPRTPRDERRRAQHNEVEGGEETRSTTGFAKTGASSLSSQSKGGILSKACDYIRDLRQSNQRLQESVKEVDRIQVDNDLCRQQIE